MEKKIIFFDGDGTIWYPSSTKRTKKPHWVYRDINTKDNYLKHIELTPRLKETLVKLKEKDIIFVLISASPHSKKVADKELLEKLRFFGLLNFFHSYHSSPGDQPEGKAKIILEILKSLNLTKENALMIGDSFFYDYLAVKNVGVDALFIKNEYAKMPNEIPKNLQTIKEVSEVLSILT